MTAWPGTGAPSEVTDETLHDKSIVHVVHLHEIFQLGGTGYGVHAWEQARSIQ